MAAALAVKSLKDGLPAHARSDLERTLGDFTRSEAASPELREILKGVKR